MKAALKRSGAVAAAMSGSGSTVFGLFQKRREAVIAAERLKGSGWRVILTESLGRGEYAGLAAPKRTKLQQTRRRSLPRRSA
jgi:homoserine kinase